MDLSSILSDVVSGLICAALVGLCSFLFNHIKKSYNNDRLLFTIRLSLSASIFSIFLSLLFFNQEVFLKQFLSIQNLLNLWLIVCDIVNIRNIVNFIESMIKYYVYTNK